MIRKTFLVLFVMSFLVLTAYAQENTPAPDTVAPQDSAVAVSTGTVPQDSTVTVSTATSDSTSENTSQATPTEVEASTVTANGEAAAGSTTEETKEERPKNKSYYYPKRNHNPMMSPKDYDDLRRAEQARIDAEREAKLAAEMAARMQSAGYEYDAETKVPKKKVDPLVVLNKKLRLQGIMGNMVIINNESYGRGDVISRTGGAKVKTIGGNYIIIEYKGRTLKKVMKN
jgi:hypothetical protein